MRMTGKKLVQIALLLAVLLVGKGAFATTYYVDYARGNDADNGTSKLTPWQHAPGMKGCSSSCSGAHLSGGDRVILKGGVTWPNAALPWQFITSGTSGNNVYFGVDQTWYAGSSWARPILNAGGATVSAGSGGTNIFVYFGAHYITLDNVEFTGAYWPVHPAYGSNAFINLGGSTNVDIRNNYFHGWTNPSGGDAGFGITGDTHVPSGNVNDVAEMNVFDGSDTAEVQADPNCTGNCYGTLSSIFGSPPIMRNNVFRYVSNGFVGGAQEFSGNLVEYIRISPAGNHENGFENNTDPCDTGVLFFNNIVHHTVAVSVWISPQKGCAPSYAFNNVMYDTDNGNVLDIGAALSNPNGTMYVFNNTIEGGRDSGTPNAQIAQCKSAFTGCTFANNHFITSSSTILLNCPSTNCSVTADLNQSKSAVNADGYSMLQINVFSPTSSSSPTVGKGTNLSNLCTSVTAVNSEAGAACRESTVYAVSYNRSAHSVTIPAMTATARPSSGAWDVGAYQFGGAQAQSTKPEAPTGLSATVN